MTVPSPHPGDGTAVTAESSLSSLPDGTYVAWQGRLRPGSSTPDPQLLAVFAETQEDPEFTPGRVRGWRRLVPESEVTDLEQVRTTA